MAVEFYLTGYVWNAFKCLPLVLIEECSAKEETTAIGALFAIGEIAM
jgi:hypothetical protein